MSIKYTKILLFENCRPVKGYTRSLICDLQRNEIYQIPNFIYEVLTQFNGKTFKNIKSSFNVNIHYEIDSYLEQMIDAEVIFYSSNPRLFSPMPLDWDEPFVITNVIIDILEEIDYAVKFIQEIDGGNAQIDHPRSF